MEGMREKEVRAKGLEATIEETLRKDAILQAMAAVRESQERLSATVEAQGRRLGDVEGGLRVLAAQVAGGDRGGAARAASPGGGHPAPGADTTPLPSESPVKRAPLRLFD